MFGLIKQAFLYIIGLILTITIVVSIPLIASIQILSDRENPRRWLKSEQMRDKYVDYIVGDIIESSNLSFLSLLTDTKSIESTIKNQINDEWIDDSIDQLVDNTYDWLEGKSETPTLKLVPNTDEINTDISKALDKKFGSISALVDFTGVKFINSEIEVFNFNEKITSYVPTLYQKLVTVPQKLLIAMIVVAAILFVSSPNLRKGFMLLGLFVSLASVILMWGPSYITEHPETLSYINIDSEKLPKFENLPEFVKDLGTVASKDINKRSSMYAKYLLGGGVVSLVLSQIAVKTVEVDDDEEEEEDERKPKLKKKLSSSPREIEPEDEELEEEETELPARGTVNPPRATQRAN